MFRSNIKWTILFYFDVNCSLSWMDKNESCSACDIKSDKDKYKNEEIFVRTVTIKRRERTKITAWSNINGQKLIRLGLIITTEHF